MVSWSFCSSIIAALALAQFSYGAAMAVDPVSFNAMGKDDKLKVIYEIDKTNNTQGIPVLLAALTDADTDIRKAAAGRLIFVHDKKCVQPLLKALQDTDPLVRRHALYALERLKAQEAVPAIITALKDPVMEVRYEAALTLGKIGGKQAVEPLVAALDDTSPVVQNEVIKSLGLVGDKKILPKLFAVMKSEKWQRVDTWSRTECLRGFTSNLKDPSVVPMLRELLRDGTAVNIQGSVVAREAAFILAMHYQDAAGESILIDCLKKDEYSMQMGCYALAAVQSAAGIPGIVESNNLPPCRRIAMDALVAIKSPKTGPFLEKLLNSEDLYIRTKAEKALGKKSAPAAVRPSVPAGKPKAYTDKIVLVDMAGVCNQGADFPLEPERQGRQGDVIKAKTLMGVPAGDMALRGVPFKIAAAGGKMLLVVSAKKESGLSTEADIPVNRVTGSVLYFLHTAVNTPYGGSCGAYRITYQDNTSQDIELVTGEQIYDWNTPRDNQQCLVGWQGFHPDNTQKGVYILEWVNPFPEKEITGIKVMARSREAMLALMAVTISQDRPFFAAAAQGKKSGLTTQIFLPAPIVKTRNGAGEIKAELYDRTGTPVTGAAVTAMVKSQTITLADNGKGLYQAIVKADSAWTDMVYPVTVSAQKQGLTFSDAAGLYYTRGYPKLYTPPYGANPPQFIVLGVDDCRNREGMEQMLDIVEDLGRQGAKVPFTMWCTPHADHTTNQESLERCVMIWQRLYDQGSEICNHTLNHNLNGINWNARATHEEQTREVQGNRDWIREHVHNLWFLYSFKGGGGGSGKPTDPAFSRQLLKDQNFEYNGSRGQHPDIQPWPFKLGDTWSIDIGTIDGNAPPVHRNITYGIQSDYGGMFNYEMAEGLAMYKANFEYHYNMPNRPLLAVNAFHDWGFKTGGNGSHRNQAALLKAFLKDVLITNKAKYPNTYVVTFHQLIKYMKTNDLAAIIAEGSGQDKAEAERNYPDFK
jgi:HEAT repeat protein/peptidoglycan/xylan/chitin deacetylase (PgdA/CDA1 family)